jgi:hypothetical protein
MDDYISLATLLYAAKGYDWIEGLQTVLKRIPTADVRPVVLCRDCVHFSAHSGTGSGYCGFLDIGTSQEACCSHGEKEE